MPIFYGSKEDEHQLNKYSSIFRLIFNDDTIVRYYNKHSKHTFTNGYSYTDDNKKSIMFIQLANNNLKYIKYCKNAMHISMFKAKMLYRKEDVIMNYFKTNGIINKYNNIDSFYLKSEFHILNDAWGNIIDEVKELMKPILGERSGATIDYSKHEYEISKYFKIRNIEISKEHKNIEALLESLEMLENANKDIFRYVEKPYSSYDFEKTALIEILKKVMVF